MPQIHLDPVSDPTRRDTTPLDDLRRGKPDAFRDFYTSWFPRVYRYAARRVPVARAEAITSAVLQQAIERLILGDPVPELGPWMLGLLEQELAD